MVRISVVSGISDEISVFTKFRTYYVVCACPNRTAVSANTTANRFVDENALLSLERVRLPFRATPTVIPKYSETKLERAKSISVSRAKLLLLYAELPRSDG